MRIIKNVRKHISTNRTAYAVGVGAVLITGAAGYFWGEKRGAEKIIWNLVVKSIPQKCVENPILTVEPV